MTTYELLSVIFAGIAAFGSVATAVSVAAAFLSYKKNQVNTKTLSVNFDCWQCKEVGCFVSCVGELSFCNATPHALTISYAAISDEKEEYPFSFRKKFGTSFVLPVSHKDISLSEREIKHIEGYFDLPKGFQKNAILKVVTSYGTFKYPISLQSLQEKARNQETESNNP